MNIPVKMKTLCILLTVLFLSVMLITAQEKRAMELEDIMNFHHIYQPAINYSGNWLAYGASPDRGDGYGILVSSNYENEYRIERGENPRFSSGGNWVLFTQRPPYTETERKAPSETPKNAAVLIKTSDGSQNTFDNVKQASFSETGRLLFIHHHNTEDTTLTESQNEKIMKSGSPLLIKDLETDQQIKLPFVDSWTADSLSSLLVYTLKDTLESRNGLYYISMEDLQSPPEVIDTTGKAKFNRFEWYEKESTLAYMRAEDMEKDTIETAVLYQWQKGRSPRPLLTQQDAPEGYFLPFDNNLTWSNDGQRLFFGFRPDRYSAADNDKEVFESDIDSISNKAEVDIWHGEDPLIKTHEKSMWSQLSRQNLISVFHLKENRVVQLADKNITNVEPALNGNFAIASTNQPYRKEITWDGWLRDLYIVNINTGERSLIATGLRDMFTISPDSRYVLYFEDKNWYGYDISSGTKINLTGDTGIPFYDETNDRPAPPSSYRAAGWMENNESVLIYDRFDIWLFNLSTGDMKNITDGEGRDKQTVFRIRKMDEKPLFGLREEVYIEGFNENTKVRALYSARLDRDKLNLLKDEGMNLRFRLLSGDKNTIVYSRESYDEFPDLWVTGSRFRDPERVSFLSEQIDSFNWGSAELLSFTSADGVPLQGVVIKPGDYDPSKTYPVFVYYYEKFSQRLHDFNQTVINHRPSFGYYASNGYVVFLPDVHFKTGRPGMSAVNSLVPAIQKLIDEGVADPDAIGLHGHSWSGYQTAYVVTQTDIFRAAIAGAPVSNMTSAYGGIRWGSGMARQFQYETGQSRLGSSIFEKRYLYIENSPLFYAHEINTPMLIMHGDDDEAVPWEQSIELYLAMRRAEKDIIFLQYRDEPHHPQKYQNKVDYTIRMKEYFDYHLRGYEPAEWIIEGVPYSGN
ncbi:MAG: S9 family peptidase [Bacteroidales bacterium]